MNVSSSFRIAIVGHSSVAPINAAAGTGFANLNAAETRQFGFEMLPNPAGKILGGWIFQPGYVVEVAVIQCIVEWLECGFEVGEIHHPSGVETRGSRHIDG